jgi:hypothetical protein
VSAWANFGGMNRDLRFAIVIAGTSDPYRFPYT